MALYTSSILGLLIIVCAHLFVRQAFPPSSGRNVLLDGLTGVAIAYAFVDVFPHLASMQRVLETTASGGLSGYLAHHAYLMALFGFIVYLGVKTSLIDDSGAVRGAHHRHRLLILSMCLYNYLIGYMLAELPTHRVEPAILFGIAMAAHVLGLNHENRRPDPAAYDRVYRFLLAASVIAGWSAGVFFEMSDLSYALWFAYLAGGIVSAGVATELPRVTSIPAFVAFTVGALLFVVLILWIEALST